MAGMRLTFLSLVAMGALVALTPGRAIAGEDTRELVQLPLMMQEHMLANMRDHLVAFDEILGELADGNVDAAASIAEERLGMSSLSLHGAEHLGQFMPKAMGEMGTQMHRAASRFVLIAQEAELNPGKEAQHKVYQALQDITRNCNACHSSFKIR